MASSENASNDTTSQSPIKQDFIDNSLNNDSLIQILIGLFVMVGILGHGLLKAGIGQRHNFVYNLMIILVYLCLGIISFWSLGYGFACGEGNFVIGLSGFFSSPENLNNEWIWKFTTLVYGSLIVQSGGLERNRFLSDILVSILTTIFLIPFPMRWAWHPSGWLKDQGYIDFAGEGILHLVCGTSGGVLAALHRPRKNSSPDSQQHMETSLRQNIRRSGNNLSIAVIGSFMHIIGLLAVVVMAKVNHQSYIASSDFKNVMFNGFLALGSGGLVPLILSRLKTKLWSIYRIQFGMIAGLVSCSAAIHSLHSWQIVIVGSIGGLFYILIRNVVIKLNIDDPLEVIAVHCAPAFIGIPLSLVINPWGKMYPWTSDSSWMLAWNFVAVLTFVLWSIVLTILVFGLLSLFGRLSISEEDQIVGNDQKMREVPYLHDNKIQTNNNALSSTVYQYSVPFPPNEDSKVITSTRKNIFGTVNSHRKSTSRNTFLENSEMISRVVIHSPENRDKIENPKYSKDPPPFDNKGFERFHENSSTPAPQILSSYQRETLENQLNHINHDDEIFVNLAEKIQKTQL